MTDERLWRLAAGALALGSLAMLVKGAVRATVGDDLSLVPWFGLGATLGLGISAFTIQRPSGPIRSVAALASMALAAVGSIASLVAVGYLVTGTIPETPGAPAAVSISYGTLATCQFLALLLLGIVVARQRTFNGPWRWVLVGVIVAQFPVFIIAGAIGEAIGRENLTDGLGLAMTGGLWMLLPYAMAKKRSGVGAPWPPAVTGRSTD